jgi:phosphate transport system substrate-binding protein
MNPFLLSGILLVVGLPLRAATSLPPARALLLNEAKIVELTSELAQYEDLPTLTGSLASGGSGLVTLLVNRWAAEFAAFYPNVKFNIRGGGSVESFPDFLDGKLDLMPMGRPLSADEIAEYQSRFGHEPAQIVVGQDAVGIYVNKKNPLAGLTLVQLDGIYSRDAKRGGQRAEFWRDLGVEGDMAEQRVRRLSLSRDHGTHQFFRDEVMLGSDYRFGGQFEMVSSSLVQAVGADDTAIGFASVVFATVRTRFVPLQAADGSYLLPSYENTISGRYPLARPMRIVFHGGPDESINPVAREFLRFAVSRRGQRIIALANNYPLTVEQQQQALQVIDATPRTPTTSR